MSNPYEEKLAQFVQDEIMFQAVKSVLDAQFDMNDIDLRGLIPTDEVLGQILRSKHTGRLLLEEGFKELKKYKKDSDSPPSERVNDGL